MYQIFQNVKSPRKKQIFSIYCHIVFQIVFQHKKKFPLKGTFLVMVRITEFESARVSPLTPEISASTSSAISAFAMNIITLSLKNIQIIFIFVYLIYSDPFEWQFHQYRYINLFAQEIHSIHS